ncbi:hypothetical protein HYS94_05425 [Candidatus Daviesbacteria bacterium]|nr:hypothetical protein [Candidatus Daviesbacteria bacterium]
MLISGKAVAEEILKKLKKEIDNRKLKPGLAIILAGDNPASRIYVNNKVKAASRIGIQATLYEFSENEQRKCLNVIDQLNNDSKVDGIIIQYPIFQSWNFDELVKKINPTKDVDGFLENSPFSGATALGVWEMINAFAKEEGFKKGEEFLKGKKIIILGKGKTAF